MKRSAKLPQLQGICRAGRFTADARAHAAEALNPTTKKRSRAADDILYALVALLLLAGLTHCKPAREAAQQRHRDEHGAPVHGHYEWYWADADND